MPEIVNQIMDAIKDMNLTCVELLHASILHANLFQTLGAGKKDTDLSRILDNHLVEDG